MIDIHTHILPKMDDGSKSPEQSVQMLKMMADQGFTQVFATPHFYANRENPESFFRRRSDRALLLRKAVSGYSGLPSFRLGAEVHYFDGFFQAEAVKQMCIEDTNVLLLEMPFHPWTLRMMQDIYAAQQNLGIRIILAHIERYLSFHHPFRIWDQLDQSGVWIQSNAEFFLSGFAKWKAFSLLKKGKIHFLGSDAHNITVRAPNLGNAVSVIQHRLGDFPLERIESLEEQAFGLKY